MDALILIREQNFINPLFHRPTDGRFVDSIFNCIFLNKSFRILIQISQK